jgi:cytidylate kinase
MSKKINIAIDGHSSCGKSTISKQLAKHFGYTYIDSGAMYRSVCLYCLNNEILVDGVLDLNKLIDSLDKIEISFSFDFEKNQAQTLMNGINVEEKIRSLFVSQYVSIISKVKQVREKLIQLQRKIGQQKGVVMDGRDIGSVVFPDAELKFFITASLEERAKRRFADMHDVSYDDVLTNLKKRDFDDSTRTENPLIKSEDSICIDNTDLSKQEQFKIILEYCHAAMNL